MDINVHQNYWNTKYKVYSFHLFETNDLKGAAAIINNYQAGCPTAYHYFEYLHKKGLIEQAPLPHDQIVITQAIK